MLQCLKNNKLRLDMQKYDPAKQGLEIKLSIAYFKFEF